MQIVENNTKAQESSNAQVAEQAEGGKD